MEKINVSTFSSKQVVIQLFIAALLIFSSCNTDKSKDVKQKSSGIIIRGSDTEYLLVQELCENYFGENKMEFDLTGEGTSKGIDALILGQTDIANCSRPMTEEEIFNAKLNKINPVPAIIALDAVAMISHPLNPVDSISTIQLKGILSGEITNWKQLGGENHPIRLYGRNESSGTYKFLENKFVRDEGFASGFVQKESNQEILEAVQYDRYAIGYVGVGFLTDEKGKPNDEIWAMYLYTDGDTKAISPYETYAVIKGEYPLVRPLYQYFNGIPTGVLYDFLMFELSEEGQEIVRNHGFFPLTHEFISKNVENGIVVPE